ncbi:U-box domain-containing protein 45-like isoform X1 [Canna indica]|uniref:RING-type E3 ubiquitin transferase n=1 Tax=Canna indica TaxID=4628 RepID=A0AAQ3Q343_9LILI|nr:U-box domain-containing protein 45-like isoform X1 [Canna indica]
MDAAEVEGSLFIAGDAKVHGGMFRLLHSIVCKVLEVFPFIEAARPRSKSGIQALCSLHVALDKAKSLLQHCSDCSKLYLVITGDSILIKFEKAKCALQESLRRVEEIVPEPISCQITEIIGELEETMFELDQSEKQAGDGLISLLQKDSKFKNSLTDSEELEVFHQAALRLGITSSRAALTERRALKKLIERARAQEDKMKDSILSYLYHLMRKYSKLFRSEYADDTDSQGSTPHSPTILGFEEVVSSPHRNSHSFDRSSQMLDRQLSKLRSFNFKHNGRISGNMPIPPEEFICPISLQLMFDPVIISSGQTYERLCIEKWFNDDHSTCPKTQQQLSHLCLTPNYCVKGLIASWCEQNGFPIPNGPPESLDANYWRLAFSQCESMDSGSFDCTNSCNLKNSGSFACTNSCNLKNVNIAPLEESGIREELTENDVEALDNYYQGCGVDEYQRYRNLLSAFHEARSAQKKFKVVEQIRYLLKEDEEARIFMGANGVMEVLIQFLRMAIYNGDEKAQETSAMALFNLAVNNNRNKEMLITAGFIPLLEQMFLNSKMYQCVAALYLNLSCLNEAKPAIGSSKAVPFLIQLLQDDRIDGSTCKHDALYTLYNLSTHPPNISSLVSSGIIDSLHPLLGLPSTPDGIMWAEKALAVLINLASSQVARMEIVATPGIFSGLAGVLDFGEPTEQEQAVSCLLILCTSDERCSQMVLQEGVIPSLVSISVNGTTKGKEKAEKLLKLFREQRQQEPAPLKQQQQQHHIESNGGRQATVESKKFCKSRSKKLGRTLSSLWKNKSFSIYQC